MADKPLRIGNKNIPIIKKGTTNIVKAYKGTQLIFDSTMASASSILYNTSDWTVLDSYDTTLRTSASDERLWMRHTLGNIADFDVKYIEIYSKAIDLTNYNTLIFDIEFVVKDSEGRTLTTSNISSFSFDIRVDFSAQYATGGTFAFYQAPLSTTRYFNISNIQSTNIEIMTNLDSLATYTGSNFAEYTYLDFYLKLKATKAVLD